MEATSLGEGTLTIFRYVWHIITAENLIFGVALMWMALAKNQVRIRFTVWLIVSVAILLLVVILLLGNRAGRGEVKSHVTE